MLHLDTTVRARQTARAWSQAGESIALVATMGSLHEGHASLIRRAVAENDRTVVSVFVNPTQFGPTEDFETYPRDLDADCALCGKLGADAVFAPVADELYADHQTWVTQDDLVAGMEGACRPGHFKGVLTVVAKLMGIVRPTRAYFGQKDAQQLAAVTRMAADLFFDVEVVSCPIVRDDDGLALSSRNRRLSPAERTAAAVVPRALLAGRQAIAPGASSADVASAVTSVLADEPLAHVDYVSVVDAATFQSVERVEAPVVVCVAVRIGGTRLLDNFAYDPATADSAPESVRGL